MHKGATLLMKRGNGPRQCLRKLEVKSLSGKTYEYISVQYSGNLLLHNIRCFTGEGHQSAQVVGIWSDRRNQARTTPLSFVQNFVRYKMLYHNIRKYYT